MLHTLQHIDLYLFKLVHIGMSNEVFDTIMPLLRIPYVWAPVYLFLLVWMWIKFRTNGLIWCAFFFVTFVFCDYISAHFIKNMAQRIRPCNDGSINYLIHKIVQCGSGYSFPSTHATNHFGLSFFMIFTLRRRYRYITVIALIWAVSICFAQVYVGVHYPFDIMAGALLGIIIAKFISLYFHKKVSL